MEFALKWMYSVDKELEMPYQDNLQSLMNAEEYQSDCRTGFMETYGFYPSDAVITWLIAGRS